MVYQSRCLAQELALRHSERNSCVDHVAEVLRQWGADVPQGALGTVQVPRRVWDSEWPYIICAMHGESSVASHLRQQSRPPVLRSEAPQCEEPIPLIQS